MHTLLVFGIILGYLLIGLILAFIGNKIIGKKSDGTLEGLLFIAWPGVPFLFILFGFCFLIMSLPELFGNKPTGYMESNDEGE